VSRRGRRVQLLIGAALVAFAPTASANGRFPEANQLVFDPADSKHAAVRTTFGLLRTDDEKTGYEGCGCTHTRESDGGARAARALILAAAARRGISSVRPRLPCGRSDSVPPWPSASPSRSSS